MVEKQGITGSYFVSQEADFYDQASEALLNKIRTTDNVTLLKKVYASGFHKIEAFDRLLDLGIEAGIEEALLEIMLICQSSKLMSKQKDRRVSMMYSEKVAETPEDDNGEETDSD